MEKTIKIINDAIVWYEKNSSNAGIDKLLDFQDKLAAHTAYISDSLNKYHSGYVDAYRVRKWTFNKEKTAFIKEKSMTAAQAESESHKLTEVLKEQEDYNYNIGYKLNLLIKDCDRILKVCQQRISFLKMEYDQSKKQNIT